MEWLLWVIIAYYGVNLAMLPGMINKQYKITSSMATFQALIWVGFIIGLLVIVL